METLTLLLSAVVVIELGGLLYFAMKGTQLLEQFVPKKGGPAKNGHHHGTHTLTNYSVWKYRDGAWLVIENRCEPGFQPGEPPLRPGSYPNEVVRKPAIRQK
jgi:hypothetical protein